MVVDKGWVDLRRKAAQVLERSCINDDDNNDQGRLEPAGAGVDELCCAAVSPSDGISSLKILYISVLTALTGLLGVMIRLL